MDLTILAALLFGLVQIWTVHKLFTLWSYCHGAHKTFVNHTEVLDLHTKILDAMYKEVQKLQSKP